MNGDWPGKLNSFLPTKAEGGGYLGQFVLGLILVLLGVVAMFNVGGVMPFALVVAGVITAAFPVWRWVTRRRD